MPETVPKKLTDEQARQVLLDVLEEMPPEPELVARAVRWLQQHPTQTMAAVRGASMADAWSVTNFATDGRNKEATCLSRYYVSHGIACRVTRSADRTWVTVVMAKDKVFPGTGVQPSATEAMLQADLVLKENQVFLEHQRCHECGKTGPADWTAPGDPDALAFLPGASVFLHHDCVRFWAVRQEVLADGQQQALATSQESPERARRLLSGSTGDGEPGVFAELVRRADIPLPPPLAQRMAMLPLHSSNANGVATDPGWHIDPHSPPTRLVSPSVQATEMASWPAGSTAPEPSILPPGLSGTIDRYRQFLQEGVRVVQAPELEPGQLLLLREPQPMFRREYPLTTEGIPALRDPAELAVPMADDSSGVLNPVINGTDNMNDPEVLAFWRGQNEGAFADALRRVDGDGVINGDDSSDPLSEP
jgi:hypothetical protein